MNFILHSELQTHLPDVRLRQRPIPSTKADSQAKVGKMKVTNIRIIDEFFFESQIETEYGNKRLVVSGEITPPEILHFEEAKWRNDGSDATRFLMKNLESISDAISKELQAIQSIHEK